MKYWRQFLGTLAALALIYPLVLYCGQKHLYLFPDKGYISPAEKNMPEFIEKPFITADGMRIMGWYAKGEDDKPAVLFFHGNSGQIAKFAPSMKPYIDNGYTVFMSEYRGFGGTIGEFTQDTLYADAAAAFDFLYNTLGHSEIIVFGYSMGTAAASFVAANRPLLGLVLAAPFYSLKSVAGEQHIPLATMMLKYELPSFQFIKKYQNPLLIIHGDSDTLIDYHHGQDLFAICPSKNKMFRLIPEQSHNALFFGNKGHPEVLKWLDSF
ncbi:MAG: lysophospholipase [Acetobacter sp.]|nr:lysophospholipase [Acetobacter sp.]